MGKIVKCITVFFLIVNAVCGASFLWGFTSEMLDRWHMKYYRDHGYPLVQTQFVHVEKGKPVLSNFSGTVIRY